MMYTFSDLLMYSREVYLYYLRAYSETFVIVRWTNVVLSLALLIPVWRPSVLGGGMGRVRHRIVTLLIAYFWAWIALAFHGTYFTTFNYAAYVFVVVFLLESLLFLVFGTLLGRIRFRIPFDGTSSPALTSVRLMGLVIYFFSLLVIPLLTWFETGDLFLFGWTAEATVLGTMGLLLLTQKSLYSYALLVIPLLYLIWGGLRARAFGLLEGYWLAGGGMLVLLGVLVSWCSETDSTGEQPGKKTGWGR